MVKNEEFCKIRKIFAGIGDVNVHPKHGSRFHFRVYMNDKFENAPIDSLELGVRSYNCLKRAGINTIGELCYRISNSGDLHTIRNCGKTSVAEIMDSLFACHYYQLKPERQEKYLAEVIEINLRKNEMPDIST